MPNSEMPNSERTSGDSLASRPLGLRPDQCPVYILAGGRSSRFGSDKARVKMAAEPLLLALLRSLSEQGHSVEVVADRDDRYGDLGLNCLVDRLPDQGPLAGVATALEHRAQQGAGWLMVLSCDLYLWREEWFAQLTGRPHSGRVIPGEASPPQPVHDAIAFVSPTPAGVQQWEPFPSLLHTRLLPQVVERLQLSQRSLQALFRDSRSLGIETQDNPQAWSFNTVEQLRALRPE